MIYSIFNFIIFLVIKLSLEHESVKSYIIEFENFLKKNKKLLIYFGINVRVIGFQCINIGIKKRKLLYFAKFMMN